MIQVEKLTKYYGNVMAVEDVSFKVEKGEVVGFLGPNGAGKTTTMRILTCFLPASSGKATVAGYDVFKQSLEVRKHIGYLPENVPLYPEMTVRAYLEYVSKIKRIDRKKRKSRIDETLEITSIEHMQKRLIGHLSKGYRQRVGLAQALLHNPDVLILDEPTVGLDPAQIIEIRQLIKDLGKEHTIILSTHILPEASVTCGRIIIINEGRIVGDIILHDGKISSVKTAEFTSANLGESEKLYIQARGPNSEIETTLKNLPGVIDLHIDQGDQAVQDDRSAFIVEYDRDRDIRELVASTLIQKGWGLLELRPVTLSLEEIFLRLTATGSGQLPSEMPTENPEGIQETGSNASADRNSPSPLKGEGQGEG